MFERKVLEMENENIKDANIKALGFGVKGSRAEKDLATMKYDKKKAKVVKTKKKIDPRLKKELLKNYGFVVKDN
jgi:hypothetical protein